MHYIESGAGTPLVLLHAFPVDARMWNPLRIRLEDQLRVITPDQRGLGESALDGLSARNVGAPSGDRSVTERPSIDLAAADILDLLDQLELPQVVLGGCSMGGYVAMAVLRAAPERVAGLLLVDTKAAGDNDEQRTNRLNVADRAEREGTNDWLAENMLPNLLGRTSHEQRPEVVAGVRELIDAQPAVGVAWAQRAMAGRPDSTETLLSYLGPALVVVGEEDTITPPENARELAAALPEGELVTLAGVGHLPSIEDPDMFVEAVRPWLSRIS
ncbi:alpha/beta fold hydrolase [Saccharopolyspora phatthalungensis]|uniref:Pimeloyl-ACP methyl ester carboxylesterase n=1 Tax=Saccharopolyspora phatthalungensis TaxID=664693 RepID=A0A840Q4D3_9PSEU|nr:alpha/beta fold hydrolase [Saccharopolyspora phatthalungensis]MBB5155336.1 pimeloyl-ACP methyl ester carboxylesterase [Saccharopolyspora phatthalungensis]